MNHMFLFSGSIFVFNCMRRKLSMHWVGIDEDASCSHAFFSIIRVSPLHSIGLSLSNGYIWITQTAKVGPPSIITCSHLLFICLILHFERLMHEVPKENVYFGKLKLSCESTPLWSNMRPLPTLTNSLTHIIVNV